MRDSLFSDLPQEVEPPPESSRKWLVYLLVAAGGIFVLALGVLPGPSNQAANDEEDAVDPVQVAQEEEKRLLEQVVEAIQPSRLGTDTTEQFVSEELNRWWRVYGSERDSSSIDLSGDALPELLGDDATRLALQSEFSRRDVAHLASAFTLNQARLTLTTGLTGDREKVTAAFYYVVRNIEIVSNQSVPPTLPYQALLWGRGRAEDRIWAFVELLRQTRIDSFLVLPADGDATQPLVAVAIGEGVLLFDPAFGLPIPSLTAEANDTPLPQVAATYTEALQNDAVFRQLDAEGAPYPWTADALRNVRLLVVGSDSTFSPRMQALQQAMPSQFTFLTFDGWDSSALRTDALRERVQAAADELPEVAAELGAWTYPLVQAAGYDLENGLDNAELAERTTRLNGPLVLREELDAEGNKIYTPEPASFTLQMARALHIQADYTESMRRYLPMRNAWVQYERSENRPVAEMSWYWATLCQLEVGFPELAIPGFQQYLRNYENGQFASSATYWMAISRAMNGETQAAIDTLQSTKLTTIRPGHLKYLAERWSRLLPTPEEEADEVPPTSEATESETTEEPGET